MLPDTTGRFGLTQVLDEYGGPPPMTSSQIQSEAPHYDFVWGSFQNQSWLSANPNIILSRYVLDSEDMNYISGHDLSWWQANHPDWIFYACDSSGNPTHYLAWDEGSFPNDVPIAFYKPEVQAYEQSLWIPFLKNNGYKALAADNMNLPNYTIAGNPNNPAPTPDPSTRSSYFGCGTYDTNGNFVRRYSSRSDTTYTSDTISWAAYMQSALHSNGLKLVINHPLSNPPTDPNEQQLLSHIDGMLDENGYTHYGTLLQNSSFASTLQWAEYTQQHNIAIMMTDYFCTGSGCNDNGSVTAQQADWALASYAIGNEGGEDVYISPYRGSDYSYRNEYSTRYGAPCGGYTQPATYVYERKFAGALVIVNASTAAYTLSLPSGHSYTDIERGTISGSSLTVNPADAYFLLTTNGCS